MQPYKVKVYALKHLFGYYSNTNKVYKMKKDKQNTASVGLKPSAMSNMISFASTMSGNNENVGLFL